MTEPFQSSKLIKELCGIANKADKHGIHVAPVVLHSSEQRDIEVTTVENKYTHGCGAYARAANVYCRYYKLIQAAEEAARGGAVPLQDLSAAMLIWGTSVLMHVVANKSCESPVRFSQTTTLQGDLHLSVALLMISSPAL
jgi:hypothetical protein